MLLYSVDASQTAGVFPIDVKTMHIDVLCFTGHKGLLGPQGTGGLHVSEGLTIHPLKSGGSGVKTYSHYHPTEMPTALEAGTLNGHGIAGLNAAVAYIERVGMDQIRETEQKWMWLSLIHIFPCFQRVCGRTGGRENFGALRRDVCCPGRYYALHKF